MRGRQSYDGSELQGAMAAAMATITEGNDPIEDNSWRVREGAVNRYKMRTVGRCARPYVYEMRNFDSARLERPPHGSSSPHRALGPSPTRV